MRERTRTPHQLDVETLRYVYRQINRAKSIVEQERDTYRVDDGTVGYAYRAGCAAGLGRALGVVIAAAGGSSAPSLA